MAEFSPDDPMAPGEVLERPPGPGTSILQTSSAAFSELKQRLEALGYDEPLGIETAPLVERLVSDLIATTDAYRSTKEDLVEARAQSRSGENMVEPLKRHNARLLRENAKLHKDAIDRETEILQFKKNKLLNEKSLQDKLEQLLCVHDLSQETIRENENEIERLRKRLLGAIKPQGAQDGANRARPGRQQRSRMNSEPVQWTIEQSVESSTSAPKIEMTKHLRASGQKAGFGVAFVNAATQPAVSEGEASLLASANEQLDDAQRVNRAQQMRIQELTKQVEVRDAEISRLGTFLGEHGAKVEPNTPEEMAAAEEQRRSRVELVAQVEYLAAQTAEKTEQLAEMSHTLETTSQQLEAKEMELEEVTSKLSSSHDDIQSSQLRQQELADELHKSNEVIKALEETVASREAEIEKLTAQVQSLHGDVRDGADQAEQNREIATEARNHIDAVSGTAQLLHHDNAELRATIKLKDEELDRMHEQLAAARSTRAKLETRVRELMGLQAAAKDREAANAANEEAARAKNTALATENASLTAQLRHLKVSMGNLSTHVQGTEALLQASKDELAVATAETAEKTRIVADLRDELVNLETKLKNAEDLSSRLAKSQGSSRTEIVSLMKEVGTQKVVARRAEGQLDAAQQEIARLQGLMGERERSLQELQAQLRKEGTEKKRLRTELVNASHSLSDAQRALTSLQNECRRLSEDLVATRGRLDGKEKSVESLKDELARAHEDADRLRNRIDDVSRAGETSHRAVAEQRGEVDELRHRASLLKEQLREANSDLSRQQNEIHTLQARLQTYASEHSDAKRELASELQAHSATRDTLQKYREKEASAAKQLTELKSLFHELEVTRQQLNDRVQEGVDALAAERQLHEETRVRCRDLANQIEVLNNEVAQLKNVLRETDQSRDGLMQELDDSAEARAKFAAERGATQQAIETQRRELENAQKQCRTLAELLEVRDDEFRAAQQEANQATDDLRVALAENNAIREQLTAAARDLQAMAKENSAVNEECTFLRQQNVQFDETVRQLRAAVSRESQLKDAEQAEKADILENYRAVCNERARLDVGARGAQQSLQKLRAEAEQARAAQQRLEISFASLQRSHRESALENRSLQAKLSQQARKLYQATLQLQEARDIQRQNVTSVSAAKSVATAAQGVGQQLRRDTAQLSFEVAAARHQITRLQASNHALSIERQKARSRVVELENLLHSERHQFAIARAALQAGTGHGRGSSATAPHEESKQSAASLAVFGTSQKLSAGASRGVYFNRDHLVISDEEKRDIGPDHPRHHSSDKVHDYPVTDANSKTDSDSAEHTKFSPGYAYRAGSIAVDHNAITITPTKNQESSAADFEAQHGGLDDADMSGTPSISISSSSQSTSTDIDATTESPASSRRRRASPEATAAIFEEQSSLQELLGLDDNDNEESDADADDGHSSTAGTSDERGGAQSNSDEGTTTSGEVDEKPKMRASAAAAAPGGGTKEAALPFTASTRKSIEGLNGLFSAAVNEADTMQKSLRDAVTENEKLRTELHEKLAQVRQSTSAATDSALAASQAMAALNQANSQNGSALEALGAAKGKDDMLQRLASQLENELDAKDDYIQSLKV